MDVLKIFAIALFLGTGTGCQLGYYVKSGELQLSLTIHREPIDDVLKDPKLAPDVREKLLLAQAAREFAIQKIGLEETKNYTKYVQLDRPYVTWVVSAAPRWKLEHYQWWYPFVGKMPYKGFASEEDAEEEQKDLEAKDLDTYVRGVSAYSTLGVFQDSVLSSMLRSPAYDLVNTIIHETTHATIYVHGSADFNERLAVFVGNKGTEQFYRAKEGSDSPTVALIAKENEDDRLFSEFIGPQLKDLENWYKQLPPADRKEELRQARFKAIQNEFLTSVLPKMKTKSYDRFSKTALNNARLLYFRLYMQDLKDFENLFDRVQGDWPLFIRCLKTLEKVDDPATGLKSLSADLENPAHIEKDCPK